MAVSAETPESAIHNRTLEAWFSVEATGARRSIVLTTSTANSPAVLDGDPCAGLPGHMSPVECVRDVEAAAPVVRAAGVAHCADPRLILSRLAPRAWTPRMVVNTTRFDPSLRRLRRHTSRQPPLTFSRLRPRASIVGGVERTGGHGSDPFPTADPYLRAPAWGIGTRDKTEGVMGGFELFRGQPR